MNAYFSRVMLNPSRREGRKLITNPYAAHAAVMAAFSPAQHAGDDPRPLWRIDDAGKAHTLYIVSACEPDLRHIQEQAGWQTEPGATTQYDRFLDALAPGQVWAFRLLANPVKRERSTGQRSGKILPHVTVDQQIHWLEQRAEKHGFRILTTAGFSEAEMLKEGQDDEPTSPGYPCIKVTKRKDLLFYKGRDRQSRSAKPITIRVAQFDGVLEVTDAAALKHALVRGIGRAKGFGCGLLTLSKAEYGADTIDSAD